MQDLIEKLEKATGPDRKLDGAIAKAVGAEHGYREFVHLESRSYSIHDEIARHYTASIDAALTLVPEPWAWEIYWDNGCELSLPPPGDKIFVTAVTPAIAICIAALKARLALAELKPHQGKP